MNLELPPLKKIREIRTLLGWTQKDLASETGLSQSMIAKIENGSKSPSYEAAEKIFYVLNRAYMNYKSQESGIAADISTKTPVMIFLNPEQSLRDGISKMGSDFDQLPVLENKKNCIGTISSKLIITLINQNHDLSVKIKDIMEDPLTTIPEDTPLSQVRKTLEAFDCVLTTKKGGEITGIITRSDLIKKS